MVCRTGVSDRAVWHVAALCDAIYQVPHNCNVVQRVGKHIFSLAPNASSNELSNDTSIPVHSKFEASALPFPNTNALGWNWLSRVEMQKGMVGGRVGFLVAGLWEALLKNVF